MGQPAARLERSRLGNVQFDMAMASKPWPAARADLIHTREVLRLYERPGRQAAQAGRGTACAGRTAWGWIRTAGGERHRHTRRRLRGIRRDEGYIDRGVGQSYLPAHLQPGYLRLDLS
eukprot:445567-Prymnesium_polylepis.1